MNAVPPPPPPKVAVLYIECAECDSVLLKTTIVSGAPIIGGGEIAPCCDEARLKWSLKVVKWVGT